MIRNETIEEFKKRGGEVTKLETVDSSNDYLFSATCAFDHPTEHVAENR
jgi:hypothetical protein